ncbi:class I SAM-dependent methyltransferase [Sedimentitalea sp. HM32M-2]|uniref:class I SAM-dependent methyltransferase n=1 Tax=Sedimentitalea sp. HM32M-2 TaxID=3351566 RepID=UPI00362CE2BD
MATQTEFDAWSAGQSYEHYMGRWSRRVAAEFLRWLNPPADRDWLEVGCGTGALTQSILSLAAPKSVLATDQSADFVTHAEAETPDGRVTFGVADAMRLPCADASVDIVTSALVLNFIPDKPAALAEMCRALRPGGVLSFYVWDYPGGGMGFIDAFWQAAAEIDPKAAELDEGRRFPFCTRDGLTQLCDQAGIAGATVAPIQIETRFPDFDAFWHPFTLGAGPAPGYCSTLPENQRMALKRHLAGKLGTDGPIILPARAWAVRAPRPV